MNATLRLLLCLFAALWFALPSPGDEGGENASGTGVWILPACATITTQSVQPTAPTKDQYATSNLTSAVNLRVATSMGATTAVFIDDVLGISVPLDVSGRTVKVPAGLLQAISQGTTSAGPLVIVDSAQNGYLIRIRVQNGSAIFDLK